MQEKGVLIRDPYELFHFDEFIFKQFFDKPFSQCVWFHIRKNLVVFIVYLQNIMYTIIYIRQYNYILN